MSIFRLQIVVEIVHAGGLKCSSYQLLNDWLVFGELHPHRQAHAKKVGVESHVNNKDDDARTTIELKLPSNCECMLSLDRTRGLVKIPIQIS